MRMPFILLFPVLSFLAGCAHWISEPSRSLADRNITFSQIMESPDAYRGKYVLLGGTVAAVTHTREGTQLEVEEHRLDSRELADLSIPSRGRFLATTAVSLDLEQYTPGTLVSIMGEVAGKKVQVLHGVEYTYPIIAIKEIRDTVIEEMPDWGGPFGGM